MNARLRRHVEAARTGIDGLALRHWRSREPTDARVTAGRRADLRMVPLAAAGWGAAWLGTRAAPAGIAAAAAGVTVALVVAGLRRSATVLAVALVTTAIVGAAIVDVYRLRHGPVARLADQEAMSLGAIWRFVRIHIGSPPAGVTAAAGVMRAATVRIAGPGTRPGWSELRCW